MGELYNNLKLFGYPAQLEALATKSVTTPVHIRMKPINACNHRCWFCAYRADNLELGDQMRIKDRIPAEKMREIVEDVIAMGVKAVTFSGGGEPLLYPEIVETATRLAQSGIKVATLTNGAFLENQVAETFARYATWVRVSMDYWDAASCAKSRGVKITEFDRIMSNMRSFLASGTKCVLGVSFIVGKENADHIGKVCRMFKELGVNHIKLSPCIVSTVGTENNAYHEPIRAQVNAQIEEAARSLGEGFIVNDYHQLEESWDKPYRTCPFLQFLTIIGADCNVYTCQDKAYTSSGLLGSIKDRRFKEFWFSEENRARMYSLNPSCECRHHCVANSKNQIIHQFLKRNLEHAPFV